MVHVASSRRSHGDEAEDGWFNVTGCIGLFYPNFAIFIVLGHKGSLVISFPIIRTPRAGGEVSTQSSFSHPLGFRSSCLREERRELSDLANLPNSGRMFG
jgi:hypothetical protein